MKKIITYGTFDLLHQGHINILKRAKEMGDYLVVGVTSEEYDAGRGKLNVFQTLGERIENVMRTGFADKIIVEGYFGQKIEDIQKYGIDTFVIGSDWEGKFDYLKEYCEVVYLERTKGISSTELRNNKNGILRIGIIGTGRIACRFVKEAKYVSGVSVESVFGHSQANAVDFANKYALSGWYIDLEKFLDSVDAVYIASPHLTHYDYAKKAIMKGKHVLCEKPMVLEKAKAVELFGLAEQCGVILQEAMKTAYAPCFIKAVNMAKSGLIGQIRDVSVAFTKLVTDKTLREYKIDMAGGCTTELASYPLCAIARILGENYEKMNFYSFYDEETKVDVYTKIFFEYKNALAEATVGIGAKREGDMVIAGTKGYIYVPAPWWKTEYFEVRFEDLTKTQKFFAKFEGDGLRYELAEFANSINKMKVSYKFSKENSIFIADIIEQILKKTRRILKNDNICAGK